MASSFVLICLMVFASAACATLEELTKEVEYMQKLLEKKVYFQVHQKQDQTKIASVSYKVLKFDEVTSNEGKAYDEIAGKFYAPMCGTYMFWAHVQTDHQAGNSFHVKLMKEGKLLAQGFATWKPRRTVASFRFITRMKKGEKVTFEPGFIGQTAILHGNSTSHYGGTLLL